MGEVSIVIENQKGRAVNELVRCVRLGLPLPGDEVWLEGVRYRVVRRVHEDDQATTVRRYLHPRLFLRPLRGRAPT
jgi:hypothetical protein